MNKVMNNSQHLQIDLLNKCFRFFMKLKFKCHIKTILRLKKTEVKKSMQSLKSIGIDI